jgi:hypothetical protein
LRVDRLLALADGVTVPIPSRLPYVAAVVVVAVLGLQVAAGVASLSDAKFAIVWGSPEVGDAQVWSLPRQSADEQGRGTDESRFVRSFRTRQGFTLREEDLPRWLSAMATVARKRGVTAATAWLKARSGWEAVPVFSDAGVGPLGIYRVERAEFPPRGPNGKDRSEKRSKAAGSGG